MMIIATKGFSPGFLTAFLGDNKTYYPPKMSTGLHPFNRVMRPYIEEGLIAINSMLKMMSE